MGRTPFDAGAAMGTILIDVRVRPSCRRDRTIGNDRDQSAGNAFFRDQRTGQAEGPKTADKGGMTFRPVASKGLRIGTGELREVISGNDLPKTPIDNGRAGRTALLLKPLNEVFDKLRQTGLAVFAAQHPNGRGAVRIASTDLFYLIGKREEK